MYGQLKENSDDEIDNFAELIILWTTHCYSYNFNFYVLYGQGKVKNCMRGKFNDNTGKP